MQYQSRSEIHHTGTSFSRNPISRHGVPVESTEHKKRHNFGNFDASYFGLHFEQNDRGSWYRANIRGLSPF